MDRRVFVSSTFTDLAEHRQAVQKAIRQLGALDISMENFGARDERPKEECLRLIRDGSDIFVGIYAHRYGYVSAGDTISITEAEYNAATDAALPRLIYILDDSTPWVPALIDKGEQETKLVTLKRKLKANHICAFFANKDELATKVAADLGRFFSEREPGNKNKDTVRLDPDRESRLIEQLKSSDKYQVKRSIRALSPAQSPWLIDTLRQFIVGEDEELADTSVSALREIPGRKSAQVLASGLNSRFRGIRSSAAFALGEMALFGRKEDAESVIDSLITAATNLAEELGILDEIIHSIAKVGGPKATDALIDIIQSKNMPAQLKAKAIHGPGRFWKSAKFQRKPSHRLYEHFVKRAIPVIENWPVTLCEEVINSDIFEYIEGPLRETVLERANKKGDSPIEEVMRSSSD